ncbi:MAG: ribonuclease HI family protein [Anaerolineales bacterium]
MFDGGSKGNPGPSYGSYKISPWGGEPETIARMHFGRGTNNEAEYLSLIAALRSLRAFLHGNGQELSQSGVEIRGDSQLVLRQVGGKWKAKDSRMRALRDEAESLLRGFGKVSLIEQPRERTVEALGH